MRLVRFTSLLIAIPVIVLWYAGIIAALTVMHCWEKSK
jgi:hypothetical protein